MAGLPTEAVITKAKAVTYCMEMVPTKGGCPVRCSNEIDAKESVCFSCKKRLEKERVKED